MKKKILYRFFEGNVSIEQGMKIKTWVEASDKNRRAFYQERKLYDAVLLNEVAHNYDQTGSHRTSKRIPFWGWIKMVGVIALTLCFSYLYNQYQIDRSTLSMNTLSVPEGQRANLTLPDGTNVWINARTTLQYPSSFRNNERRVILKGEAYFKVTKNEKQPFIVETEQYNIKVLGTAFNVEAYPHQQYFETTLMEGSVTVSPTQYPEQTIALTPGYKVCTEHNKLQVLKVDSYDSYRWKEGLICFTDESFADIMKDFEKYYGLKIEITNKDVIKYKYTGKFRQSDGIDYALKVLQQDIYFSYTKDYENQFIRIN